ncbi:MAG: hypothetical protein M1830_003610 [Pleopsidium flavum]|nr:MAG: hypothetical protein M1830_003610 [Pleopsidium flavum]
MTGLLKPSPFATSSSRAGQGIIRTTLLPPGTPSLSTLTYTYPLKLIAPSPTSLPQNGHTILLIFLLTYGGGLVAGDAIDLSITLAAFTRLALVTQGSTKIFKTPNRSTTSRQTLDVRIGNGAGLCYLPDPTQPFAESCYEQKQVFTIEDGASLCVLDWVSEGRSARGEKWDFWRWSGKNEIWTAPPGAVEHGVSSKQRLLLRDNVILDDKQSGLAQGLDGRMDGLGVFGTLILHGALFENIGKHLMDEFMQLPRIGGRDWSSSADAPKLSTKEDKRAMRHRAEKDDGLLWTAASVRGFVLVKFGAREVEGARRWLGDILREEGSVQQEFGDGALLCLR